MIMKGFWAVILLTFRESLRKKILLIFIIFCVGLIISSAFFPVISATARIKLVETWTFQTVTFFGILIAVFLAAVSIPADIETKRMFLVLTKPISKEIVMIGRLAGFIVTVAFIILIMGVVGMVYVRAVALFTPGFQSLVVREQEKIEVLEVKERIKPAEFLFQQMPIDENYKWQAESSGSIDGIFSHVKDEELEVSLRGDRTNVAGWKFQELYKYPLPDKNITAEIKLKVSEGLGKVSSDILVRVLNPTTKQEAFQKINITFKKIEKIIFDRSLIDRTGEVRIYVMRENPESYITVTPESVLLLSAPVSFEWNFLKALFVVFLKIVLILIFCVTCSVFLSGPVNIFLNIFIYFCGSGMQFLQSSLESMKYAMLHQIRKEQIAELSQKAAPISDLTSGIPIWLMDLSDKILVAFLKIVPDFSRFDAWDSVLQGYAVNFSQHLSLFGYIFIYMVIMLAIGFIAFRLKDVK